MVHLAVGGYLSFFQRVEGHHIEVVVAHISHHLAVGRESGETLLTTLANLLQVAVGNTIDIVAADAAVPVDGLKLSTQQNLLLVLRELVGLHRRHGLDGFAHGILKGTHHVDFLARLVAILLNTRASQNTIVFTVLHGTDGRNAHGTESGLRPNVVQSNLFSLRLCANNCCHSQQQKAQFLHKRFLNGVV